MHIIRTSAEMAELCQRPLDPELVTLLGAYAAALEEFGEDLSATIIIADAGDRLAQIEHAYGEQLVADDRFTFIVELITEHSGWYAAVRIISDDGGGLVLLINKAGDPQLIAACRSALAESSNGL